MHIILYLRRSFHSSSSSTSMLFSGHLLQTIDNIDVLHNIEPVYMLQLSFYIWQEDGVCIILECDTVLRLQHVHHCRSIHDHCTDFRKLLGLFFFCFLFMPALISFECCMIEMESTVPLKLEVSWKIWLHFHCYLHTFFSFMYLIKKRWGSYNVSS